jgi:predicted membrane protein
VNSVAILLGTFALCVFLLLNGPLWLSTRLHVFAHGPEAPHWFILTTRSTSYVVGAMGMFFWLTTVSHGNTLHAVLLGVILIYAAFLLLNGPLWLVTRTTTFARGSEAPVGLQVGFTWFCRIMGVAAIASALYLAFWLQLLGSQ